jgi:hypothetical protein
MQTRPIQGIPNNISFSEQAEIAIAQIRDKNDTSKLKEMIIQFFDLVSNLQANKIGVAKAIISAVMDIVGSG